MLEQFSPRDERLRSVRFACKGAVTRLAPIALLCLPDDGAPGNPLPRGWQLNEVNDKMDELKKLVADGDVLAPSRWLADVQGRGTG